ncbi:hypothetical protein [Candidatus Chloroploca sp. Khr17]|uniref:hypothetical protein n=1 Tax=Candidatus Chloroploca sp. Khr17 TaxID=2496869 RepID=UPI00196B3F40|nr:hypothetical protein [Candidatus Chloroploca sp. Khr17]
MAQQHWWQRAIAAIDREYERRIRAASRVTEYGVSHHHHDEHDDNGDDGEVAEIMNIPKGTRIAHRSSDMPIAAPSVDDQPER